MSENQQEVLRVATALYRQRPDWVTFFREVLGLNGIVRRVYPDAESLAAFEQTEAAAEIQQMLTDLRRRRGDDSSMPKEPTRVITVRLPKSLHESLRVEAHEHQMSMNKLCISKLLKVVEELVASGEDGAPSSSGIRAALADALPKS